MNKMFVKFMEELDLNYFCKNVKYKVIEDFPLYGKRRYSLKDLRAEIESEMVYFYDSNKVLLSNTYVLNGFSYKDIKSVKKENDCWIIIFKSGSSITIKIINK